MADQFYQEFKRAFGNAARGVTGTASGFQFDFDQAQALRMMSYLEAIKEAGPKVVASELNKAALLWQREIMRHCPVDTGILRMSFQTSLANAAQLPSLIATVGTNVPYAVHIEFGNAYIAGGRVAAWEPGKPLIMDWKAKRADATKETAFSVDAEGRGRNLQGAFTSKSNTASIEFMPPMRGSWQWVAPIVEERLARRLAKLIETGKVAA